MKRLAAALTLATSGVVFAADSDEPPPEFDRQSLEVTYVCGNLARTASANEHRTINLECRF